MKDTKKINIIRTFSLNRSSFAPVYRGRNTWVPESINYRRYTKSVSLLLPVRNLYVFRRRKARNTLQCLSFYARKMFLREVPYKNSLNKTLLPDELTLRRIRQDSDVDTRNRLPNPFRRVLSWHVLIQTLPWMSFQTPSSVLVRGRSPLQCNLFVKIVLQLLPTKFSFREVEESIRFSQRP